MSTSTPPPIQPSGSTQPPAPPRKKGTGWGWLGCGVVGALLVVGGCGGALYYLYTQAAETFKPVMETHLEQVIAGDFDAAYEALAPAFKETTGKQAFIDYCKAHVAERGNLQSLTLSNVNVSYNATQGEPTATAELVFEATFAQGTLAIDAVFHQHDEMWQIAGLNYR